MSGFRSLFFVCLTLTAVMFSADAAVSANTVPPTDEGELVRVVVLSRHGVRSPTQSRETLEAWSGRAWPEWPVRRGWLTERGALLTSAMWENLRARFAHDPLTPAQVFVRADLDQRTQATARALLDGLGLNSAPYAVAKGGVDPLFHPVRAGVCSFDADVVRDDILRLAGGDLDHLARALAVPLKRVSDLAAPPGPELCRAWHLPPDCVLADIPNRIDEHHKNHAAGLRGGLAIGSSLAEIFLLEYAEWPDAQPAWGKADGAVLREILPLHNRVFDVVNRAPAVAGPKGSALLAAMEAALAGNDADPRVKQAVLTVFVGHDTNIANIGGLLGITWDLPGHGDNSIPPAAVLALELREREGQREVSAVICAQSLETLHGWTASSPPDEAAPVCRPAKLPSGEIARYSLESFSNLVRATVGPECALGDAELAMRERP